MDQARAHSSEKEADVERQAAFLLYNELVPDCGLSAETLTEDMVSELVAYEVR
ncbi:hypothetical protein LTR85_011589 [Meristemomyces frigidus]|nr:hypothetical protein LTR85_011589 [Meristemomyces frigidus]